MCIIRNSNFIQCKWDYKYLSIHYTATARASFPPLQDRFWFFQFLLAAFVVLYLLIYFEGVHKLHISITCVCYIKSVDPISISYACVCVSRAMYKLRVHQNYIREFNIGTELQFTVRVGGAPRCRHRPL